MLKSISVQTLGSFVANEPTPRTLTRLRGVVDNNVIKPPPDDAGATTYCPELAEAIGEDPSVEAVSPMLVPMLEFISQVKIQAMVLQAQDLEMAKAAAGVASAPAAGAAAGFAPASAEDTEKSERRHASYLAQAMMRASASRDADADGAMLEKLYDPTTTAEHGELITSLLGLPDGGLSISEAQFPSPVHIDKVKAWVCMGDPDGKAMLPKASEYNLTRMPRALPKRALARDASARLAGVLARPPALAWCGATERRLVKADLVSGCCVPSGAFDPGEHVRRLGLRRGWRAPARCRQRPRSCEGEC